MPRSFAALVLTFATLLFVSPAGAQQSPASLPDSQPAATISAPTRPERTEARSTRARQLDEVKVVAPRSRRTGYLVTSSRTA